ncbi:DUF664 domain-containing protein [Dankookia rubra]|uniref:DUF664 domain-containing protein n=2 Tax=Dankookia rubra TaxID=1442381 RepID=A0A4V3A997_9PROT|nr:DUF664 domain-containing protein [Dankookia rubra]
MGPRQEHFRMLALYNQWANARLYDAAGRIAPEALAEERGAFFGSLLGTLNHLLVTDRGWMARLEGESPRMRLDEMLHDDFSDLRAARVVQDQRLADYVHGLSEDRLAARLDYATSSGAPQSQPLHHVLAHLFNHQTHHRGQAHHLVGLVLGREATPVLDLLAYQRSTAAAAVEARQGTALPHDDGPPGRPPDDGPTGPGLAATRVQVAAMDGVMLADKEVPEPDSLGG